MKVRLFREYGALNSKPVFDAFEAGLLINGDELTKDAHDADVVVIWSILFAGRMAPNKEVWENAIRNNIPVIVLEVGALRRGDSWKIGIGGINRKAIFVKPFEENRFENFGISVEQWKKGEGFVTIFTQRPDSQQWEGLRPIEEWVADNIKQIRKTTKRKILIRPHPRDRITDWSKLKGLGVYFSTPKQIGNDAFDHQIVFDATYAAVNYSSGPSVQTVLAGIHTHCSLDSLAYDVSTTIDDFENPPNKDRSEWLQMISHTEWFLSEIKKGIPWYHLRKFLNTKCDGSHTLSP